ncbi:Spindle assembly abnormal protein 6-like [Holothuria leucospilota]|uniref:Spindle assembly abnormal protein 6 homolog n=1 Tax=Holothuria leucospilota TaxID=206669 RepID=A0A9Q1H9B2_HOLLE|nr:Spindle assembly abnormal protein 6-like [Holothuria leucospilota]
MENILFDKVLSVLLKIDGQDSRSTAIHVTLETSTSAAPLHRKELLVRLTDDTDSFFLYTLALGEDDFQFLKNQQGLLIDFGTFPQKLIELLELCLDQQNKESPKFVLHLSKMDNSEHSLAELAIVETNPFKHLTHLTLKVKPGSDLEVKQFLAKCLKQLQEEHRQLQSHLQTTESSLKRQLMQSHEVLHNRTQELEKLKSQWESQTESLTAKHQQQLAEERESATKMQREMEQTYLRQKQDLESRGQKQVEQMQGHIMELQTANRDFHDQKQRLESLVKDLRAKLATLEEDYQRLQLDSQNNKRRTETMETEHHSREQLVSQLRTRVAVLEQESKDKETLITKSNELLEAANQQKEKSEESLQHKQTLIRKLEATVKSTSAEVVKGNEIIKKLQGELKASLAKLKLKNAVTSKQEKVIEEKSKSLQSLEEDRNTLRGRVEDLEKENKGLNETLETLRGKLEESKQLLKTNENVISWLNKQVNEVQVAHRQGMMDANKGPPTFRPTFPGNHVQYQPPRMMTSTSQNAPGRPPLSAVSSVPSRVPSAPAMTSTPASLSAIPESTEFNILQHGSGTVTGMSPALDPKYLQSGRDLSGKTPSQVTTGPMRVPLRPVQPQAQPRPPLMSAYFPPGMKENGSKTV